MGYVVKKAAQRFEEKKAAIYVRVSTQYQVDRASLPVQREELINYAKYALGISDYVIFEDAGYSAKNTDRPDYQQMMARMRTASGTVARFLTGTPTTKRARPSPSPRTRPKSSD